MFLELKQIKVELKDFGMQVSIGGRTTTTRRRSSSGGRMTIQYHHHTNEDDGSDGEDNGQNSEDGDLEEEEGEEGEDDEKEAPEVEEDREYFVPHTMVVKQRCHLPKWKNFCQEPWCVMRQKAKLERKMHKSAADKAVGNMNKCIDKFKN